MLWGTTGTAQALAPAAATSEALGALRAVVGAAALGLLAVVDGSRRHRAAARRPNRRAVGAVALAGLGVALYQLCFFNAVRLTGVAIGTLVAIGSAPVLTGIADVAVHRRRPGPRWFAATMLAVLGAGVLLAGGDRGDTDPGGVLLAVGAGGSYALLTLASKSLLDEGWRPVPAMAAAFGVGALLLLPLLLGAPLWSWTSTPRGAAAVLWLGVAATALAYVSYARGLRDLTPPTVATLSLAEPLTAALLGVAVLGERPGPPAAVGGVLVVAGLLIVVLPPLLRSRTPARDSSAATRRVRSEASVPRDL